MLQAADNEAPYSAAGARAKLCHVLVVGCWVLDGAAPPLLIVMRAAAPDVMGSHSRRSEPLRAMPCIAAADWHRWNSKDFL